MPQVCLPGRTKRVPVTSRVRVRYAETDQMGVVYYANYFVWFEIGRVEVLRSVGLSYSRMEKEHRLILPVVDASCRYRSPARYDEEILIETRPVLLRGSVLKFAYRILRAAGDASESQQEPQQEPQLLAEGETVHVVCDENMNRQPLPEEYAAALRALMDAKSAAPETAG
jgi:acyl-CoA thioester hydrolase